MCVRLPSQCLLLRSDVTCVRDYGVPLRPNCTSHYNSPRVNVKPKIPKQPRITQRQDAAVLRIGPEEGAFGGETDIPERIRTSNLWLRRPTLYPIELRGRKQRPYPISYRLQVKPISELKNRCAGPLRGHFLMADAP